MSKVSAEHATIITEQVKRIHSAVNDGTLDRATVDDALAKLTELAGDKDDDKPKDSFSDFTGQSPASPPVANPNHGFGAATPNTPPSSPPNINNPPHGNPT